MKEIMHQYIDTHKDEIFALGDELFNTPELGFKEFKTKEIIIDYLNKHNLKVTDTYLQTGFSVSIGQGKPHIGLIAELDAIPTLGHPCANKEDNAAHACGHSTQVTIMLAALDCLANNVKDLSGTVTLFFTPAEEFTDMQYRQQLIDQGVIAYASGKQNMLVEHKFDDCDLLIHLHGSGQYHGYHFSIGGTLAGFIYKKITFKGKAAHAAVSPDQGKNALNMCNLFISGLNMLRETFCEKDTVRVHGIITNGGQTVNSIPEEIVYECYVRSSNPEFLQQLSKEVSDCAHHCALALGGEAIVSDTPGYLPLNQSKEINEVIEKNCLQFSDEIKHGEVSVAAGDVGDISVFKPIVQYGYTGFTGVMHGKDLFVSDKQEVYLTQAKIISDSVYDFLSNPELVKKVVDNYKPSMTYQQYLDYLNQK